MLFYLVLIGIILCIAAQRIVDKNAVRAPYWSRGEEEDKRTSFQKNCYNLRNSESIMIVWGVILAISIIALTISLVVFGINHLGASSEKASLLEEQRILTYQIENKFYENDIEYGRNELFRDVTAFNKKIQSCRAMSKDFWIGIYVPNFYDDIPLIELPTVKASE